MKALFWNFGNTTVLFLWRYGITRYPQGILVKYVFFQNTCFKEYMDVAVELKSQSKGETL